MAITSWGIASWGIARWLVASAGLALTLGACGGGDSSAPVSISSLIAKKSLSLVFSNPVSTLAVLTSASNSATLKTSLPSDAKPTGAIEYSSSDITVAAVDSAGKVSGINPGTATIQANYAGNATYSAAKASYQITVTRTVANDLVVTLNLNQALDFLDLNHFPTPFFTPPNSTNNAIQPAMGLSLEDDAGNTLNANMFYLANSVPSTTNPFVAWRPSVQNNNTKSVTFTFQNDLEMLNPGTPFKLTAFVLDLKSDQYDCPGAAAPSSESLFTKSSNANATSVVLNCVRTPTPIPVVPG